MQPFIQALPLTALNDALRGVMLDGASLVALGPALLNLALWGVAELRGGAQDLPLAVTPSAP